VLHWLLAHHKSLTISSLLGFMIGAIHTVYPWTTSLPASELSLSLLYAVCWWAIIL